MSLFVADSDGWTPIGRVLSEEISLVDGTHRVQVAQGCQVVTATFTLDTPTAALLAFLAGCFVRFPEVCPLLLHEATLRALLNPC